MLSEKSVNVKNTKAKKGGVDRAEGLREGVSAKCQLADILREGRNGVELGLSHCAQLNVTKSKRKGLTIIDREPIRRR